MPLCGVSNVLVLPGSGPLPGICITYRVVGGCCFCAARLRSCGKLQDETGKNFPYLIRHQREELLQ